MLFTGAGSIITRECPLSCSLIVQGEAPLENEMWVFNKSLE